MTRSEQQDPQQDNPFDLGLPMVRTPVGKQGRKRGQGRRTSRRPATAVPRGAAAVPTPPRPVPGSPVYPAGDWEQWLEPAQRAQAEPIVEPEPRRIPVGGPLEDPELVDKATLVPKIVDRSGGNPGPALRHPRQRQTGPRRDRRRGEKLLAALTVVGVGIVVVSVVLTVIHTGNRSQPAPTRPPMVAAVPVPTSAPTASPSASSAPSSPIATDGCEQQRSAEVVSGTDPGGTATGPDAILAFERAYYVQRSGYAAHAVVADDSSVPPADQIQRGINQVPVGTRYCVQITRTGDEGQWEVRLTQQKPDEQPHDFTQIISTRSESGRTLITGIAPG
ncbi:hypothetical protein [Nocardia spumae]|uniref:hypothetical protein n=1 Tax=Nocardia spumae TaxID=2887190 RepID=UPI001D14274F|nr:hypothetical protein [Nocardia spumae]